eukprot:2479389-Heterocapsa_arctica.AAC.1
MEDQLENFPMKSLSHTKGNLGGEGDKTKCWICGETRRRLCSTGPSTTRTSTAPKNHVCPKFVNDNICVVKPSCT